MELFTFIYYLGLIACGIQGSQKSRQQHDLFCFPASFLAALGGGMFRDLFILVVFPVAFTADCIPDITIALCAGILYRVLPRKHALQSTIKQFVTIIDSLGLGTFIAIGVDKALALGASQTIAFYCGIITALGGGILSSLLCGRSAREVLTTDISYRIITTLGAFLYIYYLANGVEHTTAQYWLILYTFFFILILNCDLKVQPMNGLHHSIIMATPVPTVALLYQLDNHNIYIAYQSLPPYSFGASGHVRNRNFAGINCIAALLNYKFRCPRRFSRGR